MSAINVPAASVEMVAKPLLVNGLGDILTPNGAAIRANAIFENSNLPFK